MNYSLGNMLGGSGGGVNSDLLSLDLQFAADKTLTARRGPTPTFTRASTATFVGSDGLIQSAAINTARFDHDPVTLACKGLLIEEARTNLIQRSEEFDNAYWLKQRSSITDNTEIAPNGTLSGDKFVEDTTASNSHYIAIGIATSFTSGTIYTSSVFAKKAERNWVRLAFSASGFPLNGRSAVFNLDTGSIGEVQSGVTAAIVSMGNGWYKCSISAAATITNNNVTEGAIFSLATQNIAAIDSYTGDGTSGIFLWGAQLEAGSFATSYIPTVASSVVRSADVCSITGSAFTGFYNQSEGAMLVNAFTPASGDRTILSTDDNTANEMIRLRTEGTNPFFKVTDGGSEVVAIDAGTVVANTPFKLAGSYKVNDFASSINGGSAVTDTSGNIPTVDRMRIGAGQGGNTMCGCISSMRYFKKRVSDSRLQTLTT